MPPTLLDDHGKRITLGPELGRGGEASVFAVEGQPALVAKIYHQRPGAEKTDKLSQMVALQSERLLALAAWPVGTLFTPGQRSLAGFLMKNMSGFKDIHLLYSPKSRTREFPPKANWRFLIHAAANVARAFSAIHEHGHVIGDVNQSNVRVSPETAVVSLIDCDSFQISSHGKLFPCEVGVPLYTPPELQETEFKDVIRTPNHDNFGLAVLIFHLLFMGRHPFAGKFLGKGEMPIEKAISESRFAFAPDTQRTQMLPPPSCITLAHLPQEVGGLFIRAFAPDGTSANRPDGRQWIAALDSLASHLIICSANKAHLYFNALSSCPWCSIESSGVLLFIDYVIVNQGSSFAMEIAWSQILAVPSPGPANPPSILTYLGAVEPSARAKAAAWKRRLRFAVGVASVVCAGAVALFTDNGFLWMYVFASPCVWILKWLFQGPSSNVYEDAARAAEARLQFLQDEWREQASGQEFTAKVDALRILADEYRRLPEERKRKVRELERALYETQLRHYLELFDIAAAEIPHIQEGRKAMLSAYGIDNCADITQASLEAVPGFGGFLITQLMTWRQSIVATFKFKPGQGVDPADVQRVDQAIAKRRAEIEALLAKGPAELKSIRLRVVAARGRLQDQLEKALTEVAQAHADERIA